MVDSSPPEVQNIRSDSSATYLFFTEPIEIIGSRDSIFYVIEDSVDVYLRSYEQKKMFNKDPKDYVTTGIKINHRKILKTDSLYNSEYNTAYIDSPPIYDKENLEYGVDSLFYLQNSLIYINRDFIKDLSGNILEDSIFITSELIDQVYWSIYSITATQDSRGLSYSENYKSKKSDYDDVDISGFGGIYGRIEFKSDVKSTVVIAQSIDEGFFEARNLRNNEYFPDDTFAFEALPAGQYLLYCYENYEDTTEGYEIDSDIMYPYFAGKWEPFEPSSQFSEIMGPIEVRSNWDTKDIVLKLQESIINHGKLEEESNE